MTAYEKRDFMYLQKIGEGYTSDELLDFISSCDKVFLYGTGVVAYRIAELLKSKKFSWTGFVVTRREEAVTEFIDHPVYCIDDIVLKREDGIVLAVAEKSQDEIFTKLKEIESPAKIYAQKLFSRKIVIPKGYLNGVDKKHGFFANFQELNNWGEKFNTDKCHKVHDYLRKYELFLQLYKDKEFTLLELGVFHGESLATWGGKNSQEGYFSQARVIGVDINSKCVENVKCQEIVIKDLGEKNNIGSLREYNPSVIVDDASHYCSHQIMAIVELWDVLPSGGIYIMEDIETSFTHMGYVGFDDAVITAYDFCQAIAESTTSGGALREIIPLKREIEHIASQIDMISFIHGSCIMVKK